MAFPADEEAALASIEAELQAEEPELTDKFSRHSRYSYLDRRIWVAWLTALLLAAPLCFLTGSMLQNALCYKIGIAALMGTSALAIWIAWVSRTNRAPNE